MWMV